jgi:hypothetical protein
VEGILNAVLLLSKQRGDFEMVIVGPATDYLKEKVLAMGPRINNQIYRRNKLSGCSIGNAAGIGIGFV